MQDAISVTVVIAGLFFSLTCALLLEEFIFGGLFHLLRPLRRPAPRPQPEDDLFGNSEK
ncbi:MAG: hypothetical protein LAO06_10910 [Acidobacteriia bacterium]|nr:hypothetical protein [Terriglobia bacterium]MBZ5629361.1 hypothetical protein [Terriglobia bacterium]